MVQVKILANLSRRLENFSCLWQLSLRRYSFRNYKGVDQGHVNSLFILNRTATKTRIILCPLPLQLSPSLTNPGRYPTPREV